MNAIADHRLIDIITRTPDVKAAEWAWEVLLARHRPAVETDLRCRFRGQSPDVLDEAMGQALLKILISLPALRNRARFRAFFRRIARNCVLDVLRFRSRWRSLSEDEDESDGACGLAFGPISLGGMSEEDRALFRVDAAAAIAQLPPRQREVFCLFHRDGYKYREIAEQLGICVGAVGNTLVTARARLTLLLEIPLN
jgi:RNA polymerase sigma factor (sigma-70 family)